MSFGETPKPAQQLTRKKLDELKNLEAQQRAQQEFAAKFAAEERVVVLKEMIEKEEPVAVEAAVAALEGDMNDLAGDIDSLMTASIEEAEESESEPNVEGVVDMETTEVIHTDTIQSFFVLDEGYSNLQDIVPSEAKYKYSVAEVENLNEQSRRINLTTQQRSTENEKRFQAYEQSAQEHLEQQWREEHGVEVGAVLPVAVQQRIAQQAQVETHNAQIVDLRMHQNAVGAHTTQSISSSIWKNDPEREEKEKKLGGVYAEQGRGSSLNGFSVLRTKYVNAKAQKNEEEIEEVRAVFKETGFSDEDTMHILKEMEKVPYMNVVQENVRLNDELNIAISDRKNGTDILSDYRKAIAVAKDAEAAHDAFVKDLIAKDPESELAKQLQKGLEVRATVEKIEEAFTRVSRTFSPKKSIDTKKLRVAAKELTSAGVGSEFAALPTDAARSAVAEVVEKGGTTEIASSLLKGDVVVRGSLLYGAVEEASVTLNLGSKQLSIVGEHAADKQNRLSYTVDPPTTSEFNQTRLHMIVEQNRMDYFTENQGIVNSIALGLARENPEGKSLLKADDVHMFHNFMYILFGHGDIQAGEEKQLLLDCDIVRKDTHAVDASQVERYRRALVKYVPDLLLKDRKTDDPVELDREDMRTLALLWQKDSSASPESITELQQQTSERLFV